MRGRAGVAENGNGAAREFFAAERLRRVDAERVAPPHPATRAEREWREKETRECFFSLRDTSSLRRDRNVRKEQPVPSAQFALPVLFPCDTQLPKKGDAPATRLREWRKRSARVIAENGNGRAENVEREVRVAFFFFAARRVVRRGGQKNRAGASQRLPDR